MILAQNRMWLLHYTAGRGGRARSRSGVSVKGLSSAKERFRETEIGCRSLLAEQIHCSPEVQNVNHPTGQAGSSSQLVVRIGGSQGRLLARTDTTLLPEVPSGTGGTPGRPVQSNALRSSNRPSCLHEAGESSGFSSGGSRSVHAHLPG